VISTISYIEGAVTSPDAFAGNLIRQARTRAGLSQVELAARAGVTQSVISAYESGHRQPALPTLTALVEAAGYELVMGLRREARHLSRLSGPLGRRLRRHRHDMVATAAAHGVRNLRVFGSVARGQDQPGSDVDLLADLPPDMGLFGLGKVRDELEAIVGTRVDLVPANDLKPEVRMRVEGELVAL
jgi:predicted nucleotidyltransferase/DNA-binding XRE family transcriptional regulator